jgi:hypothetical protein
MTRLSHLTFKLQDLLHASQASRTLLFVGSGCQYLYTVTPWWKHCDFAASTCHKTGRSHGHGGSSDSKHFRGLRGSRILTFTPTRSLRINVDHLREVFALGYIPEQTKRKRTSSHPGEESEMLKQFSLFMSESCPLPKVEISVVLSKTILRKSLLTKFTGKLKDPHRLPKNSSVNLCCLFIG